MRILLLGKTGQLGWELQRSLLPLGEVIALDRRGADLARPETLRPLIREIGPQAIVNAAAYTAVDKAESEPELARRVNAEAVAVLAEEARANHAWLVHYSTDYVFDGKRRDGYREDDAPSPLGVYGRTKLEGERAIQEQCRHYLLFRTSWVYGARGNNFPRTILRLAGERERLRVVADQRGVPTSAALVADVSAHALREVMANPSLAGLYHLTAAGATNWHEYACYLLGRAQAKGWALRAGPDQVDAITTAEYPLPARRPENSTLDTTRLRTAFGLQLPPWQAHVDRLIEELSRGGEG